MNITVNGKSETVESGATLDAIIDKFELNIERVVLELNGNIPDKKDYSATNLSDGDSIEIIQFVGGG